MDSSVKHLDQGVTKGEVEMMPMLLRTVREGEPLPVSVGSVPLQPAPEDPRDAQEMAELQKALTRSKAERVDWLTQSWLLYRRSIASRKFEVVSLQKFIMIVGWGLFAGAPMSWASDDSLALRF